MQTPAHEPHGQALGAAAGLLNGDEDIPGRLVPFCGRALLSGQPAREGLVA